MGLTKTTGFSKAEIETAELAKALAHPARIAIIRHLIASKSCICGDNCG
jgi:DNA-binding transcriptional ArsR family regulator